MTKKRGRPFRAGEPTKQKAVKFTEGELKILKKRAKKETDGDVSAYIRKRALGDDDDKLDLLED